MIHVVDRATYDYGARLLNSLVDRKSELPNQVFRPTVTAFRIIDIAELWMPGFFDAARHVMHLGGDESRLFLTVVRPDPIDHYHAHFRKFPLIQFDMSDDAQAYLDALNADPGGSPADAIVYNAAVLAVYPESCKWVVYGDREFEVAIIATGDHVTSDAWTATSLNERLYPTSESIEQLLAPVYRGDVPRDVAEAFTRNYGDANRDRGREGP